MSRKLYAAIVPLFAVVAVMASTSAAQAAPHWFICKKLGAGKKYSDAQCQKKSAGNGNGKKSRSEPPRCRFNRLAS